MRREIGVEPLTTFLGAPAGELAELSAETIAFTGYPHEATKLSRRGAAAAPAALREATSMFLFAVTQMAAGEVVEIDRQRAFSWAPAPLLDLGDVALGEDVEANISAIHGQAEAVAASGALLVALGGDHFVTYPSVAGVAAALDGPLGYLHVDMHLDLADQVPGYGRHASGTPVRRLLEDGALSAERSSIVGVESFQHRNEWRYAQETGLEVVSAAGLRERGIAATLNAVRERIEPGSAGIYVSIDIDVVDRTHAPGTGNAVGASGLAPAELLEIAAAIRDWPLVGLDLVEVAPRLDPSGRTAALGAATLIEALHPRLFTRAAW